jgi:hypothetical protein
MPHKKIQQVSGMPGIQHIKGTPCEHNPHQTAHGMEAGGSVEHAVERERKLSGL